MSDHIAPLLKALQWPHPNQRKGQVLAVAYSTLQDLVPAPQYLSPPKSPLFSVLASHTGSFLLILKHAHRFLPQGLCTCSFPLLKTFFPHRAMWLSPSPPRVLTCSRVTYPGRPSSDHSVKNNNPSFHTWNYFPPQHAYLFSSCLSPLLECRLHTGRDFVLFTTEFQYPEQSLARKRCLNTIVE